LDQKMKVNESILENVGCRSSPADWTVRIGETPASLFASWREIKVPMKNMIAFYQDRKGNEYREFSNFYHHKDGFDFYLPQELLQIAGIIDTEQEEKQHYHLFAPVVHCQCSETAIMLCKAAVMGDAETYGKVAAATTALEAKQLGRHVTPWDDERWDSVVCGVAVAVLLQKFGTVHRLREILFATGDDQVIICEATANDTQWAIGISIKQPKVYEVPARWKGSNILGWALMQVRSVLREEQQQLNA
jgi:ribA/ribD-fused uncharacterized protein